MRGFHNCNFFVCQAVELAESIFKFVFIIIIYFSIFFISSINKFGCSMFVYGIMKLVLNCCKKIQSHF